MNVPAGDGWNQAVALFPNHVYDVNTGVDLTQFHYFRNLPAEMRNMIYRMVLISKHSIQISSPLGKRRRGAAPNFASLLLTNKATYEEGRSIYYLCNTFAVGNNTWGRRYLSNLHGLRAFMRVANRAYLSLINHIEINVCAAKYVHSNAAYPNMLFYDFEDENAKELRSVCLLLLEHFRGLKSITIKACQIDMRPKRSNFQSSFDDLHPLGDFETAGDALRLLLDGQPRGKRNFQALDVKRFQWYQAEKIIWDWDKSGQKRNRFNSFAGYVEERRPDLKDGNGRWDPVIVQDP